MLHIDERVALPTGPGFDTKTINKIPWLYFRKGQSKRVNGKLKHDSVAIGKIVEEQDGFKTLIPNDHYYEFVAKTSPPNKGKVARVVASQDLKPQIHMLRQSKVPSLLLAMVLPVISWPKTLKSNQSLIMCLDQKSLMLLLQLLRT